MPEHQGDPEGEARAAQWSADRAKESTPLPYADRTHYLSASERQIDLAAAEEANIARIAGKLGMTSDEWKQRRKELGRSPERGDV